MTKKTVFTIGGATFDHFIKAPGHHIMHFDSPESSDQWFCLPYGAKIRIDQVQETFGGGGCNTSIGFSRLGFDAYYVGKVGQIYGDRLIDHLEDEGVNTDYVKMTARDRTGFSTILNSYEGDRTVLVYSGANQYFSSKDLPLEAMKKADLIFLNHLSEAKATVIDALTRFLEANPHIKLAWNPGGRRLEQGVKRWKKLLKHTDILFLNKQEAALFTGKDPVRNLPEGDTSDCQLHVSKTFMPSYADDVTDIMAELLKYGVKNIVITDGRNGAQATDGTHLYFCPVVTCKRVDSLGAGDSFATAFTAATLAGQKLNESLKYGTISAYSVVSHFGAQTGLLTATQLDEKLQTHALDVRKTRFPTL